MGGAPGEYFGRTERREQERDPEKEAGYTTGNLRQLHSIQLSFTRSSVHYKILSLLYTVRLFYGGLWPAQDRNHGGGSEERKYELNGCECKSPISGATEFLNYGLDMGITILAFKQDGAWLLLAWSEDCHMVKLDTNHRPVNIQYSSILPAGFTA